MIKNPKLEKERLIQSTDRYKENLEGDLTEITSKVERGILAGLVVGGLAFLTYKVVKSLSRSDKEESKETPEAKQASSDDSVSKVGQYVAQTIALILINLAKEKLMEYLNERKYEQDSNLSEDN